MGNVSTRRETLIAGDNQSYLYGEGEEVPVEDPPPPAPLPGDPAVPFQLSAEFLEFQRQVIAGAEERRALNETISKMADNMSQMALKLSIVPFTI